MLRTFEREKSGYLKRIFLVVIFLAVVSSCATYYQSNFTFNQEFETGQIDKAYKTLQQHSSEAHGKKEFLYFVNNGLVLSMMSRYGDSNDFFEKAYLFGEDYRTNYLNEAASYLTNPNFTSYKGEDHEHLLLLYYKAINYLKQNNTDDALVECRRLNIRLQQLSDRYKSKDKYEEDAFAHVLMGMTYEVDKDYNNAFIAYRNAMRIYRGEYQGMFGVYAPDQLKEDLLRAAWLSGMKNEFEMYKDSLNLRNYVYKEKEGELVFIWHNGLSPVKTEWGVDFVINRQGNWVYFSNQQLGLVFPFNMDGYSDSDKRGLASMDIFRVAFPKYVERPPYFSRATISINGDAMPLQLLEDVNKIAFKCLEERMGHEFAKALLRVALKKAEEYEIRKKDKTWGSIVGVINALTEKADTRNWQTLPHSIYYCRVPLKEGENTLTFTLKSFDGKTVDHTYTYQVKKGQTLFHTYSSLESNFPGYGSY
ncbi:hypothetical protein WSM22_46140 [Cytophagales bacterium WSM2-2]|nr:hypothetical protein WSM22_46140 [Cytophagales bacterium WSM2-2]